MILKVTFSYIKPNDNYFETYVDALTDFVLVTKKPVL